MPSRRAFVQSLCVIPVLQSLSLSGEGVWYRKTKTSIDVVRTVDHRNYVLQSLPSENPTCFICDHAKRFLFALNEINEYQGLPRGSVESYSIHPYNGELTFVSRQPLSLSATMPRHFVLSPDLRHMVVAVYGGGAYNVLPVRANGELGPVGQIIKEVGSGPHPEKQASAHPHSLLFHPGGRFLLASDLGTDRIHVFRFLDGRMTRISSVHAPLGSGPGELFGRWTHSEVVVMHELHPSFFRYQFNADTGGLT